MRRCASRVKHECALIHSPAKVNVGLPDTWSLDGFFGERYDQYIAECIRSGEGRLAKVLVGAEGRMKANAKAERVCSLHPGYCLSEFNGPPR